MYGSWTENVVVLSIFLGFIWDFLNLGFIKSLTSS